MIVVSHDDVEHIKPMVMATSTEGAWTASRVKEQLEKIDRVSFEALIHDNCKNVQLHVNSFCYFGSKCGMGELSNFATCPEPFEYHDKLWPSSEHAFQAVLRLDPRDWHRFAVGGDLSTLAQGMTLIYGNVKKDRVETIAKKVKHWSKAKSSTRPEMVGIVAKMAVKEDVAKRLGLRLMRGNEKHNIHEVSELFKGILMAKYVANPSYKKLLVDTYPKTLVEFNRPRHSDPRLPLWGGYVTDSKPLASLRGHNLMGMLHMHIRDKLVCNDLLNRCAM